MIAADDPLANAALTAIQSGDVVTLEQLLTAHPTLAADRFGDDHMSRTLLHAATDWPGHFPNVRAVIELLVARGADVDGRFAGPHDETALHWAASSDDVEALDALLDAGADIEARGAVLGGGAPIADAVGFAQWRAARRLIERGATTVLWESAGLGLMDRVRADLAAQPGPSPDQLTQALWLACHGGHLEAVVLLVDRGADVTWVGYDHLTPLGAAVRSEAHDVVSYLPRVERVIGVDDMTLPARTLGTLSVSALGLGCMGMSSGYGDADEPGGVATLNEAIDRGCTFLDTADAYGPHANERLLASVLRERRDEIVIATKFGLAAPANDDGSRHSPRGDAPYVASACNDSLERLGVDHIDLYYLHRADPQVPIEETVGAMADLVHAGKVRHLGLSEVQPETLARAVAVHPIAALQSEWSLWTRDIESDVLAAARSLNVGIVPFSPLGRGALTGALTAETTFGAGDMRSRMARYQGDELRQNLQSVDALAALAGDLQCTPAQLALAWVLAQGADVVPIPGTRRIERLRENLGALDVRLGAAELSRLSELFPADTIVGTRHPAGRPLASGLTPPDSRPD